MDEAKIIELVEKINWLTLYSQSALKYTRDNNKPNSLTNSQIFFLKYVKSFGSLNMGKLAQLIKTTPSFSSRLTTQLEDIGYVKRVHKPDRRKEVFVELTAKGRKTIEKIEAPDIERRKMIAELINEGFGKDGLKFANEVLDYMIKRFVEGMEK